MKLATADDVFDRMNLTGTVGTSNTTTIDSALEGATSIIESVLGTAIAETQRCDYFNYKRSKFDLFSPFTLWLTQRFVIGSVDIRVSSDGTRISDFNAAEQLSEDSYCLDPSTGKLEVLEDVYQGYYTIAVQYTAGFTEGSPDIPTWLKEAAISAAVVIQHTQAVSHGKKDQEKAGKPMNGILYSLLNEYIITQYGGFQPARSIVK